MAVVLLSGCTVPKPIENEPTATEQNASSASSSIPTDNQGGHGGITGPVMGEQNRVIRYPQPPETAGTIVLRNTNSYCLSSKGSVTGYPSDLPTSSTSTWCLVNRRGIPIPSFDGKIREVKGTTSTYCEKSDGTGECYTCSITKCIEGISEGSCSYSCAKGKDGPEVEPDPLPVTQDGKWSIKYYHQYPNGDSWDLCLPNANLTGSKRCYRCLLPIGEIPYAVNPSEDTRCK